MFVSYASDDAAAAEPIAAALRAAGIEVWFDKSELRGGDAWDRQIRKQIRECALFLAVVSAHSDARKEGYFRREWRLAVERMADMAEDVPFLLPIVIDDSEEAGARVPERFLEVQWMRLPDGHPTTAFVDRVKHLLVTERSSTARLTSSTPMSGPASRKNAMRPWWSSRALLVAVAVLIGATLAYFAASRIWIAKHATVFAPAPHSIAVLPFANMSGDSHQEYFSDGISEELIDALSRLNDLHVVARTSAFSFKHQDLDAATIARKLKVGAILEGSVRRSGDKVRITVQLINGTTGFQMWTQTYDRTLDDALRLQTEVASSVAQHLEIRLTGIEAAKLGLGGTRNAAAYDSYLQGLELYESAPNKEGAYREALSAFDQAIALDPDFALAHARRAAALDYIYRFTADPSERPSLKAQARAAAERALTLAPELGEAHMVLAYTYYRGEPDLFAAAREYQQALALSPGSAWVQRGFGFFAGRLGHFDVALAAARRAISLDERNWLARQVLAEVLISARQFPEALSTLDEAQLLAPQSSAIEGQRVGALLGSDQVHQAQAICESPVTRLDDDDRYSCLAIVYHKLRRQPEAEREIEKLLAITAAQSPYELAQTYAQLGDKQESLRWLAKAEQIHEFDLINMKVDWELDPIRNDAQFKAIQAQMNFPP